MLDIVLFAILFVFIYICYNRRVRLSTYVSYTYLYFIVLSVVLFYIFLFCVFISLYVCYILFVYYISDVDLYYNCTRIIILYKRLD